MTAALTDQQLVAKVQKGDSRAFDMLVLKYQHKIMGLISRYVHDADEVQDVAQEAFIKAYKALPRFFCEISTRPTSPPAPRVCPMVISIPWFIAAPLSAITRKCAPTC